MCSYITYVKLYLTLLEITSIHDVTPEVWQFFLITDEFLQLRYIIG